jgi:hypothetical protein
LYICQKYIFMQLVKKKRGRPKMAAKDRRIPITIMVKATKARELREQFKEIANNDLQSSFKVKGIVKYNANDIPFSNEEILNWVNTKFDVTEYIKFEMNKLKNAK